LAWPCPRSSRRPLRPGRPHFHARHAESSAKIRTDTIEVIESNLDRRQLRLVLAGRNCTKKS
jgi:hypothetical protein